MTRTLLHAKLHHLRITQADLEYLGSLTIDEDLMDAVGILTYEKILVANLENGERLETYAIPGPRGCRKKERSFFFCELIKPVRRYDTGLSFAPDNTGSRSRPLR
jgi:aspartate 1-decarboxylase